jgi:divalent metal cation (Fe/Co/Zn/Cd) transporter
MIQRIQSVLLFLVGCIMIACLFLNGWQKISLDLNEKATLSSTHLTHSLRASDGTPMDVLYQQNTWYIAALFGAAALVAFVSIFQFKNRLLQMKIGSLNTLLIAAGIAAIVILSKTGENLFNPTLTGNFGLAFYLGILALILNIIANRFILRDEKLVRSVDRIR